MGDNQIKYICETSNMGVVYVYDIQNNLVKASINYGRPYISLLRQSKNGRLYFLKGNHKVYIDQLEEVTII